MTLTRQLHKLLWAHRVVSWHSEVLIKSPNRWIRFSFDRGITFVAHPFLPFASSARSPFCQRERGFVLLKDPQVLPKCKKRFAASSESMFSAGVSNSFVANAFLGLYKCRSSRISRVLKLRLALWRQPRGWCAPQWKWVWHPRLRGKHVCCEDSRQI